MAKKHDIAKKMKDPISHDEQDSFNQEMDASMKKRYVSKHSQDYKTLKKYNIVK